MTEAQADILEAIAGFIDNFHMEVTTLSAPQVHALLDHMCVRCAGSHSFLAAIRQGTTSARPESFLERGLTHLLQSFFDRLPDHQPNLDRGLTRPTKLETEFNQFRKTLQTGMVDVTSDPALMLNFKSEVADVTTINVTGTEATIIYPPPGGNIELDAEEDMNASKAVPGHSSHS